ncbi:MAG TPA: histidinol dehydrogenase [Solirubrobacterales bacterium]|nr:histidinol dehydrogenase [Solirubrobacterales bacterium]
MRIESFDWDGRDSAALAAEIRALQPPLGEVGEAVAEIIGAVRGRGDDAVAELEERFGAGPVDPRMLPVPEAEVRSALERLDAEMRTALETAAANIRAVAEAQLAEEQRVELEQGHSVELREVPVGSAAVYAPGGGASYPSTVLMGCLPAKIAGVRRVVLATPPADAKRPVSDLILAAAAIGGADEVYPVGGAQAIAALAIGTQLVPPVDVIAGPGNRYVQEAKRQLAGEVGIDGIAGPSELMVIAGDTANAEWIALDLCAQAEHGSDGLVIAAAVETVILNAIEEAVERLAAEHGIAEDAPLALVAVPDTVAAVQLANAVAPEHLELITEDASLLASAATTAGCVFTGEAGATAFGDYAAGSNHVLPTGGAGRFQGPLGPGAFRRRMATVEMTQEAARALAPAVATLARAEGFPLHAESAEARAQE